MPRSHGPEWFGTPDAAAYLGVTLRTLYRLIDEGKIPAYKVGRVIRLRRAEVDAFVESQRIQPGELSHLRPGAEPLRSRDEVRRRHRAANEARRRRRAPDEARKRRRS
ncbi:MAG: helix-turn-helix domain-containing protein [Actinomycetota bacterium]|nr:helix-turn-helix domain-containing protein [Actinomycetota bacterium]